MFLDQQLKKPMEHLCANTKVSFHLWEFHAFLKALLSHRKMAKTSERYEFVAEIYKFWSLITLFLLLNISQCRCVHYSVCFNFCFIFFFSLSSIWFSVYYEIVNIFFFIFFNFVVVLILVFSDFPLHLFLCISLRHQAILVGTGRAASKILDARAVEVLSPPIQVCKR